MNDTISHELASVPVIETTEAGTFLVTKDEAGNETRVPFELAGTTQDAVI